AEAPPDDLPPAERDKEDPAHRPERCRVEDEDAPGRGGIDGDAGRPEPAVEEQLDEESAVRVADEDRGLVEGRTDLFVVVDDLADAEAGQRRRVGPDGFDRPVLARPGGGEASMPPRLEVGDEPVPARRRHPAAVDEENGLAHDRRPPRGGTGARFTGSGPR